ncbi:hypothetical protein M758_UG086100 [Ceratodon purpureus]|nr:hypothetical protein M758_UG086100 [Ceratodon purpureus]
MHIDEACDHDQCIARPCQPHLHALFVCPAHAELVTQKFFSDRLLQTVQELYSLRSKCHLLPRESICEHAFRTLNSKL